VDVDLHLVTEMAQVLGVKEMIKDITLPTAMVVRLMQHLVTGMVAMIVNDLMDGQVDDLNHDIDLLETVLAVGQVNDRMDDPGHDLGILDHQLGNRPTFRHQVAGA